MLHVADRNNHRVDVLDLEGNYVTSYGDFDSPSGIGSSGGSVVVSSKHQIQVFTSSERGTALTCAA